MREKITLGNGKIAHLDDRLIFVKLNASISSSNLSKLLEKSQLNEFKFFKKNDGQKLKTNQGKHFLFLELDRINGSVLSKIKDVFEGIFEYTSNVYYTSKDVKESYFTIAADSLVVQPNVDKNDASFIKLLKSMLCILAMLLLTMPVFSQHDCGNHFAPPSIQLKALSCSKQSNDYVTNYQLSDSYIPDGVNDLVKTIHININLWRKHDGTGGMDDTPAIRARLEQMVSWANDRYQNILPPNYATSEIFIEDANLRIVLDSIYYYNDPSSDNLFYYSRSLGHNQQLNDYVTQNFPERTKALNWHIVNKAGCQNYAGYSQYGSMESFYRTNPDMNIDDVHDWWMSGHLVHELGHGLDLTHTYFLGTGNNNTMGGDQSNFSMLPSQMGIAHRATVLENQWNLGYDLRDFVTGYSSTAYEVSTNEIWDFSMKFYQDILVKSGNTLTIKCEIQFVPEAGITIEKGAKLIIDGGKLSNENYYRSHWKGIKVLGDRNIKQNSLTQGLVWLKNGAVIENAHKAITTGPSYSETGGIIRAENSHFLNNKRDVEFLSYHSHPSINNPTFESNNRSWFSNCIFEINDDYIDTNNPFPNVTLWDVNGVHFNGGNVFIDTRSVFQKRDGILSIDATYFVNAVDFTNLNYGIKAYQTEYYPSGKYIQIKNSNFNALRGIYFNGQEKANVVDNVFTTNNTSYLGTDAPTPYGLYLDRCANYIVEDNDFFSNAFTNNCGKTIGVLISNYSDEIIEISRNYFDGHTIAIEAIGQNKSVNAGQLGGLEFKCNDFNNSVVDIFSSNDTHYNHPVQGIAPMQGTPGGPTYNLFTNAFSPLLDRNLKNDNDGYTYYAKSNGDPRNRPSLYDNSVTVSLEPTSVAQYLVCTRPTVPFVKFRKLLIAKDIALDKLNQTAVLYSSIKNDRKTDKLKTEVLAKTNSGAYGQYKNLMSKSGELSEEMLMKVAKQEDGFTAAMVRNVLVANPISLKVNEIEKILDNRLMLLPDYMRIQIRAGKTSISTKEFLAIDVLNKKKELGRAIQRLVEWISEDPKLSNTAKELLKAYSNTNLFEYELIKLKIYIALDNKSDVYHQESYLESIKTTEHQDKYVKQLIRLYKTKKEWAKNNADMTDLSNKQLKIMEAYLIENSRIASNAIAVLALNNELIYDESIFHPEISKGFEFVHVKEIEQTEYMLVSLNPSVDFFSIKYVYLEPYTDLNLSFVDIKGKVVYLQTLTHAKDEILMPVTKFPIGNYTVNLEADGKIVFSDRLVKKMK